MLDRKAEGLAVVTISEPRSKPRTDKAQLIRDWLVKFALNANERLDDFAMRGYQQMWEEAFADLPATVLLAAFAKTLQSCKFFPKVADINEHVVGAGRNAAEERAAQKWERICECIRLHFSPDLPWRGPGITERTRRAIAAAGGMAYLSECIGTNLVFARQRFIEAWLRWDELKQGEYLLPDDELKELLADVAQTKALPSGTVSFKELHERGLACAKKVATPTAETPKQVPVLSVEVVVTQARLDLLKKQREELLSRATPAEVPAAERLRAFV